MKTNKITITYDDDKQMWIGVIDCPFGPCTEQHEYLEVLMMRLVTAHHIIEDQYQ